MMEPQLIQVPDYDEDLDEAFVGPYGDELDETYDDEYEAMSSQYFEGPEPQANTIITRGDVSVDTHSQSLSNKTHAGRCTHKASDG